MSCSFSLMYIWFRKISEVMTYVYVIFSCSLHSLLLPPPMSYHNWHKCTSFALYYCRYKANHYWRAAHSFVRGRFLPCHTMRSKATTYSKFPMFHPLSKYVIHFCFMFFEAKYIFTWATLKFALTRLKWCATAICTTKLCLLIHISASVCDTPSTCNTTRLPALPRVPGTVNLDERGVNLY